MRINHAVYNAVIDTGSQLNVVTPELVQRHQLPMDRTRTQLFQVINGMVLETQGTTTITLIHRGKSQQITAAVIAGFPKEILLGLSTAIKLLPQLTQGTRLEQGMKRPGAEYNLIVRETETLAPWSMKFVEVRSNNQEELLVVTPREEFQSKTGLRVATALDRFKQGHGYISVMNATPQPYILNKDTVAALGRPLASVNWTVDRTENPEVSEPLNFDFKLGEQLTSVEKRAVM